MKGERMPQAVKRLETQGKWELFELSELSEEERLAVENAKLEYKKSVNPEYHAGVCAIAQDGTPVARHNEIEGAEGHAEMLALMSLYRAVKPSERKLKILALAGSRPKEELIRETEKYTANTTLSEMEGASVCGRCLKFISDYTGNFLDKNGQDDPNDRGPIILTVLATGQILRTDLRTLYPRPHVPQRISLAPLRQEISLPPDSYQEGK